MHKYNAEGPGVPKALSGIFIDLANVRYFDAPVSSKNSLTLPHADPTGFGKNYFNPYASYLLDPSEMDSLAFLPRHPVPVPQLVGFFGRSR